jgi:Universal stress protein family
MYKHVLIPTDGSDLSAKAEAAGLTLAKALDAKATALTVTQPFQFIGTEPMMLVASEPEYEKAQAARAEKTLERVKATAAAIGVPVETVRAVNGLHGLARAQWRGRAPPRQRDDQGPHPQQGPGPRLPLSGSAGSSTWGEGAAG